MVRTFIGWWLESKNYVNRENVPRNEEPQTVDGAVQLRYDVVAKHKEMVVNGTTMRKYSVVIDTDFKNNIKEADRIYTDKWYRVERVEEMIPEHKLGIVKSWPGQYKNTAVKRVYLA